MNRPIFMTTLALALGLTACDDAYWIIEQARKGGNAPGGSATGGTTPGTPATGGSSGQSACTSDVLGGEAVCLDVSTLKENAYYACEKRGLSFTDYAPYESCGTQLYRFVKFTCCPRVEPPPPPPPPPPPACISESQGGPTSCKDVGTWKRYASEACAAQGLALNDYAPFEDCGNGNTRYVKYVCCTPAK